MKFILCTKPNQFDAKKKRKKKGQKQKQRRQIDTYLLGW